MTPYDVVRASSAAACRQDPRPPETRKSNGAGWVASRHRCRGANTHMAHYYYITVNITIVFRVTVYYYIRCYNNVYPEQLTAIKKKKKIKIDILIRVR